MNFEIITSNDLAIKPCIGCKTCFTSGKCPLDKIDEMGVLREKILLADMVIFGSPVYAHNVSGDMKIFFDRISSWLHNMKLNRKYSVVISTTDTNGLTSAIDYMEKLMYHLGTKVLIKKNCTVISPNELNNEKWLNRMTDDLANKIIEALNKDIKSDKYLEMIFKTLKTHYNIMKQEGSVVDNYKESIDIGLCESKTFQEFLDKTESA